MKPEYDEALCEEFPLLYANRHRSWRETPMGFGIECGEGWFALLRDLSTKLEALILRLPVNEQKEYRADQVKEKFGTLRFYMTALTDEMYEAIQSAEAASAETCELCGASGVLRSEGWFKTLCDRHHEEREAKKPVRH
jgi:hypothetical protein